MEYQIAIYSGDAVFGRMLELDFLMRGNSVFRADHPQDTVFSEVVILDLDTCSMPFSDTYRRMIGFTRNSLLLTDDVRRQCSMILHRPFEMRLLRREVFPDGGSYVVASAVPQQQDSKTAKQRKPALDLTASVLTVNGQTFVLTPKELLVMQTLLEKRGETVTREELSQRIGESSANKADVYICYLRRKLDETLGFKLIYTVRGKGYRIQ